MRHTCHVTGPTADYFCPPDEPDVDVDSVPFDCPQCGLLFDESITITQVDVRGRSTVNVHLACESCGYHWQQIHTLEPDDNEGNTRI